MNGIAIGGSPSVERFYEDNIVGGSDGFLLTAATFEDFQSAIAQKLEAEIGDRPPRPSAIPLPAGVLLLASAIGGLGLLRATTSA